MAQGTKLRNFNFPNDLWGKMNWIIANSNHKFKDKTQMLIIGMEKYCEEEKNKILGKVVADTNSYKLPPCVREIDTQTATTPSKKGDVNGL